MTKETQFEPAYSYLHEICENLHIDFRYIEDIYIETGDFVKIEFMGTISKLELIRCLVKKLLSSLYSFPERETFQLCFVINEVCTNIIIHSYKTEIGKIVINMHKDGNLFEIKIKDSGKYGKMFYPELFTRFDLNHAVSIRKTNGFGVMLVNRIMDEVKYESFEGFDCNIIYMTKKLNGFNI